MRIRNQHGGAPLTAATVYPCDLKGLDPRRPRGRAPRVQMSASRRSAPEATRGRTHRRVPQPPLEGCSKVSSSASSTLTGRTSYGIRLPRSRLQGATLSERDVAFYLGGNAKDTSRRGPPGGTADDERRCRVRREAQLDAEVRRRGHSGVVVEMRGCWTGICQTAPVSLKRRGGRRSALYGCGEFEQHLVTHVLVDELRLGRIRIGGAKVGVLSTAQGGSPLHLAGSTAFDIGVVLSRARTGSSRSFNRSRSATFFPRRQEPPSLTAPSSVSAPGTFDPPMGPVAFFFGARIGATMGEQPLTIGVSADRLASR